MSRSFPSRRPRRDGNGQSSGGEVPLKSFDQLNGECAAGCSAGAEGHFVRVVRGVDHGDSRRARRAAVLGVIYQGVFAVAQLVCLAVLARHTPRDVFGLWMTVLALASWAPMAYFGQPGALLTLLGAVVFTDRTAVSRMVVAGCTITLGLATLLLATLMCTSPWLSWVNILNANTSATATLAQATALMAIGVALLGIPATISNFVLIAHQRGDVVQVTMIAASIVGLLLFTLGIWAGQPLPVTGALMLCGPLLGGLALWVVVAKAGVIRMPPWRDLDICTVKSMARVGPYFVAVDVGLMAIARTSDVIVARINGPEAVAVFSAVGRLPILMLVVFEAVLLPYWPVLAEALRSGDRGRVHGAVFMSLRLVLAIGGAGIVALVTLGEQFIQAWVGIEDQAVAPLVRAACLQSLGMGMLAWLGVLLGAFSMYRYQLTLLVGTALIYFVLAAMLGGSFGPIGVSLGQAGAILGFATPVGCLLLFHKVRSTCRAPDVQG